jgi:hypothetical protein
VAEPAAGAAGCLLLVVDGVDALGEDEGVDVGVVAGDGPVVGAAAPWAADGWCELMHPDSAAPTAKAIITNDSGFGRIGGSFWASVLEDAWRRCVVACVTKGVFRVRLPVASSG